MSRIKNSNTSNTRKRQATSPEVYLERSRRAAENTSDSSGVAAAAASPEEAEVEVAATYEVSVTKGMSYE